MKTIIDENSATKCPSEEKKAGGISLTNYLSVKEESTNGLLIAAIQHAENAKPMPKKSPQLDTATIQVIVDWVNAGAME
ncbi:MAG: hypothetical protein H7Y00_15750 [Fimbriimonadaceae bacterium]|nr:hypothetical protein [Chitinophagales bacterium]